MKTLLLFFLMLAGLVISAQESFSDGDCKAFFKYEVNDKLMMPYAATVINFYDLSVGKVKEWYWDFGEGNTSREQNPVFIFKHPVPAPNVKINPYRIITLTILTENCKSFYSIMINILNGTTYVKPDCKAGFKYYQVSGDSVKGTVNVQFTNLSEGDSLKYLWQFGDGNVSKEKEPVITFNNKPGKKYICLTVSGRNNCSDTFCDTIFPGTPNPELSKCQVWFGYAVNTKIQTFAPALVLDFYPKSLTPVKEWKWDFGDGTTSTEPCPTHIFNWPLVRDTVKADPNPFRTITLTIVSPEGCISKWSETINIYMNTKPVVEPVPYCHAWFKYYRRGDIMTIPEVVPFQFTDASEGKVIRRLWKFENGDSSKVEKPLVTFSIFKPTQKVCLTVYSADTCVNTWCETVYISEIKTDTVKVVPPGCPYVMRIKSGFPFQMSSCAGWAQAQVYLKDSAIKATDYRWSTGVEGQNVTNLCATSSYSVKAKTPDGCVVTSTFILNSDGTIKEIPVTWWVTGSRDNLNVQYNLNDKNLKAEWKLTDGTIVHSDSIPLNSMNGGSEILDLIVRDSSGNIVYTEKIALKAFITGSLFNRLDTFIDLYPNPVKDFLHIDYSGHQLDRLQLSIIDLSGRLMANHEFTGIPARYSFGIDLQKLRDGVYICRIVLGSGEVIVRKFIK
jgi:PKD repeat protein